MLEVAPVGLPIGARNAKLAGGDCQPNKISFDFYLNLRAAADD